jgi:SAM-dependent methyltransferase
MRWLRRPRSTGILRPRSYRAVDSARQRSRWEGPQQAYGTLSGWLIDARSRAAARFVTGSSVLDAGCNIADLARVIPPNVDYLGLEIVPEIVALDRQLHPERRFECCDLEGSWPAVVTERRFDHVALLAVVEHLKHPAAVLRQAASVLNPGGTVIVTTPHPRARWIHASGAHAGLFSRDADEEHETFFGRAELAELAFSAGLTMVYYSTFLVGLNQLAVMQATGRG